MAIHWLLPPLVQSLTEEARKSFEDTFTHRSVIFGKVLPSSFANSYNIKVEPLFNRLGWQFFISLNQPNYPTLVREFYCNLECGHNFVAFTSYVRGVRISLNADSINSIFSIKCSDIRAYEQNQWNQGHVFDPLTACHLLTGNTEVESLTKPSALFLTFESRLIHHILT